jgi:two-component system probable response regulator PhcQ
VHQPVQLAEFLNAPTGQAVSDSHVFWLACLLWLGKRGLALQVSGAGDSIQCKLAPADAGFNEAQLAAWIDQF